MRFANSPAATIFLLVLLATGGVASAQFHGAGGGEQPAEPTESAEAEKPKTGAFTADWPLPPAAQIDAELRQYMARYDGAYAAETADRLRAIQAAQQAGQSDGVAAQHYAVIVPDDYDPANPPGLMVFVYSDENPIDGREYRKVLNDRNLIWISPAGIGNKRDVPWREWVALDAQRQVRARYKLDPQRLYISGHSGGGRVASRLAIIGSDFFNGAFYFCGTYYYTSYMAGPNAAAAGFWARPDMRLVNNAKRNSRIVMFTGENDHLRDTTRMDYQQSQKDGFQMVAYLEAPGYGHAPPDADYFRRGVTLLDSPLVKAASEAAARAGKLEAGRPGEALALYEQAALYAPLADNGQAASAEVTAKADALRSEYAAAVSAAESAIAANDRPAAAKALAEVRRWSPGSADDVKRLTAAMREMSRKP